MGTNNLIDYGISSIGNGVSGGLSGALVGGGVGALSSDSGRRGEGALAGAQRGGILGAGLGLVGGPALHALRVNSTTPFLADAATSGYNIGHVVGTGIEGYDAAQALDKNAAYAAGCYAVLEKLGFV